MTEIAVSLLSTPRVAVYRGWWKPKIREGTLHGAIISEPPDFRDRLAGAPAENLNFMTILFQQGCGQEDNEPGRHWPCALIGSHCLDFFVTFLVKQKSKREHERKMNWKLLT